MDTEQKDILDLIIEMKFMFCNCSHHIASEHLLLPPCIETTIGAQISGKVKCTSCVKKTRWKVGEEQKSEESERKTGKRRKIGRSTYKDQEEGLSLSNRQLVESFDVQKVLLHSCVHALPVN